MASYRVEVTAEACSEVRSLPGNMRQRVLQLLRALEQQPRPSNSRMLETVKAGIELSPGTELRRVRLDAWRVIYVVEDDAARVSVLALRKRPPYQYDDLDQLVQEDQ